MPDGLWRLAYRCAYALQMTYWFVRRPSEPSAHVAVWWQGRLLVVHASYRGVISMPAGGMKAGEDPAVAACRELEEEVGLRVSPQDLTPAGLFPNRAQFKEDRAHVFEVELDEEPALRVDGREIVLAEFLAPAEATGRPASQVVLDYLASRG